MKKAFFVGSIILFVVAIFAQNQQPTVTSSGIIFRLCHPTKGMDKIILHEEEDWYGYKFDSTGIYTCIIKNSRGCDSVVTLNVTILNGALPGRFSVSSTKQVYFSKGNLQYCAIPSNGEKVHYVMGNLGDSLAQGVWRFADSQLDFEGGNNAYVSNTYLGWIDLFGFGTSGWKSDATAYMPYSTSTTQTAYINHTFEGEYRRADWGVFNAISNGGNKPDLWFTLSYDQMNYILNQRPNASILYSAATVNGVTGCLLLPDDWSWPEDIPFSAKAGNFTTNKYTLEMWQKMEQLGAVFLTCSPRRNGTTMETDRYFWLSTNKDASYGAYFVISANPNIGENGSKVYARAVRLVRWVE